MPIVVVLSLLAIFGVGLRLLAVPVSQTRLDQFMAGYSLTLTAAGRARLHGYLASRRRARVACVLVAASVGLFASVQDDRVEFAFATLLAGWFIGAIVAEFAERGSGIRMDPPTRVSYWWAQVPAATAAVAVLWTTAAILLRGEGVSYKPLLGWGAGAFASVLVLLVVVRHTKSHRLRDLERSDPELGPATAIDAVRGLAVGGVGLALLCLANVWIEAVPGPYAEPPELYSAVWLMAIAILMLLMSSDVAPPTSAGHLRRLWWIIPVAAALPMVWAVPVRLAQEPPLSPNEVLASAQIRLVRHDHVPAAQAELGLKVDDQTGGPVSDLSSLPTELIGRVDVARPAPDGTRYKLFAYDRRTNAAVAIYGADGAGWHGRWSQVLPVRYPWLSNIVGVRDARGFTHDPMAIRPDPETGLLWFRRSFFDVDRQPAADDLVLVLMLVRNGDSYIFWAAPIPRTTGEAT